MPQDQPLPPLDDESDSDSIVAQFVSEYSSAQASPGKLLLFFTALLIVNSTMQVFAQMCFTVVGLLLFGASLNVGATGAAPGTLGDLGSPVIVATAVLTLLLALFYRAQQRGLFGRTLRMASRAFGRPTRGGSSPSGSEPTTSSRPGWGSG